MQRTDSRNSLSMYTSQRDTMSNLFTQQQHSFYSKENTGRIGFFGPKPTQADQELPDKQGGHSDGEYDNKWPPLGRFNSASSNQQYEANGDNAPFNDDSQLTKAPSFGKMSNDCIEDANSKSVGKAASEHTGNRGKRTGTASSISGSVSGGEKGWSEQKPSYVVANSSKDPAPIKQGLATLD